MCILEATLASVLGSLSSMFVGGAAAVAPGAVGGAAASGGMMAGGVGFSAGGLTGAVMAPAVTSTATAAATGSSLASTLALAGGIAGATAGVAGGAMSAVEAVSTGSAQAKIAENNAEIAKQQKIQEGFVNRREQSDLMRRASAQKGQGIGSFGASGVDMSSGTIGSWLNDFDAGMNRDLSTMDYNSRLKQWGLENERRNYLSQANIYRRAVPLQAAAGLTSGVLGGVSALGSGIGAFKKLEHLNKYTLNSKGASLWL